VHHANFASLNDQVLLNPATSIFIGLQKNSTFSCHAL